MVRKIMFLTLFISTAAFGSQMTLREGDRVATLKKVKNYWLSVDCKNCKAQKIIESLTTEKALAAVKKEPDARIAPGTRLCNGLDGLVWALKDDKGQTITICEFKDKSYVLTNDLAAFLP